MELYQVRQIGLMVDLILWRRYGRNGRSLVEQTLVINPGLSDYGPVLPVGLTIILPSPPTSAAVNPVQPVSLFDV